MAIVRRRDAYRRYASSNAAGTPPPYPACGDVADSDSPPESCISLVSGVTTRSVPLPIACVSLRNENRLTNLADFHPPTYIRWRRGGDRLPTLAMFASSSEEGVHLAGTVEALAREYALEPRIVRPDAAGFREAIFTATVVVIDATIEQENLELYRAASVVLSPFDHVLIVGRTYLPLNFLARRAGGAAPYPYPATMLADGSPIPDLAPLEWRSDPLVDWDHDPVDEWIERGVTSGAGGTWGNDDILRWLRTQIPEILEDPGPRLKPGQFASMRTAEDTAMMRPIYEHVDAKRQRERRAAFVSHRGWQFQNALRLGRKLREGFHGPPKPAIVIEPGALALGTEMLTEVRRWMIMGLLDDELRRSDELWIVESADYRRSWWTAAELYAAAYVAETPAERLRIRIWNPDTDEVRDDVADRYRIELSDAHRKRMARILTHTRPDQLSPESRVAMRMLRWGFRLGLGWFIERKMSTVMEPLKEMVLPACLELTRGIENLPWKVAPRHLQPESPPMEGLGTRPAA
ncbi:MAG TPA: hypothetical protein VEO54_05820 [Thermoanaerobaculia bacterium]|nr:hypothetical protein [Thermoanaerobaculia bacterium]